MVKINDKTIIKANWRIFPLFAALFLVMTACGPDPFFIPVKSISGVPGTGTVGIPLTLTGTVNPVFASNNVITWIVNDDGDTGADINGNVLNTQKNGIVSIKAKVVNGISEGKDYTKDFIIVFDFDAVEKDPIINIDLTITGPAKGDTPNPIARGSGNFTTGAVSWSPSDDIFMGNTEYTATITVTAKAGYTFSKEVTAKINGNRANISKNTGTTITVSYTFPSTLDKAIKEISINTQPDNLIYTHGDALDLSGLSVKLTYDDNSIDIVALDDFTSKTIYAKPTNGDILSRSTHNNQPVKLSLGSHSADTNILTVNKAAGAGVTKPVAEGNLTDTKITVTAPSNLLTQTGQNIEYAISESSESSANLTWTVDKLIFTGAGDGITLNTHYYIYARSAANDNYEAGTPSVSAAVGIYPVYITINLAQITDAAETTITGPTLSRSGAEGKLQKITFSIDDSYNLGSYSWEITGTGFTGTGITGIGNSFTLDATDARYNQIGEHHLTLIAYKDGVPYNKTIIFTIVN